MNWADYAQIALWVSTVLMWSWVRRVRPNESRFKTLLWILKKPFTRPFDNKGPIGVDDVAFWIIQVLIVAAVFVVTRGSNII